MKMFRTLSKWCRRVFSCAKKSGTTTADKNCEDGGQLAVVAVDSAGHVEATRAYGNDAEIIAVSDGGAGQRIEVTGDDVVRVAATENGGDAEVVGERSDGVVELLQVRIEFLEKRVEKQLEEMKVLSGENDRLRTALDGSERRRVSLTAELISAEAKEKRLTGELRVAEMEGNRNRDEVAGLKEDQKLLRRALRRMEEERIAMEEVLNGGEMVPQTSSSD